MSLSLTETVVRCRMCTTLFKISPWAVSRGDPSCCASCNAEADQAAYKKSP